MDSWLSCGTATTLTHTPMPCFSFAEETAGNQGFTLRQGWFCPDAKRLDGSGRFQWPRNASEARQLTRQEFRWLMEGLAIDQPKAIKAGSRKKDF